MRILGTEPSSVILSRFFFSKDGKWCFKCANQDEVKWDGVILVIHKITISINFNTENIDALMYVISPAALYFQM